MKVKVLLNLGTSLVQELGLAEAYTEGCVCDVPQTLGDELVKRGVAVAQEELVLEHHEPTKHVKSAKFTKEHKEHL